LRRYKLSSGKEMEYGLPSLELKRKHQFGFGEGWGMTTDGCDLLVTTGSYYIYRLKTDFSLRTKYAVRCDGRLTRNLNELEYVHPKLWVHVWHTDKLIRVNPRSGECEASLILKGLYSWKGEATPNGVAYSPAALGMLSLLVTGKKWPTMFKLTLNSTDDLCGGVSTNGAANLCPTAPPSACSSTAGTAALTHPAQAKISANPIVQTQGKTPLSQVAQVPSGTKAAAHTIEPSSFLAGFLIVMFVSSCICVYRRNSTFESSQVASTSQGRPQKVGASPLE